MVRPFVEVHRAYALSAPRRSAEPDGGHQVRGDPHAPRARAVLGARIAGRSALLPCTTRSTPAGTQPAAPGASLQIVTDRRGGSDRELVSGRRRAYAPHATSRAEWRVSCSSGTSV